MENDIFDITIRWWHENYWLVVVLAIAVIGWLIVDDSQW